MTLTSLPQAKILAQKDYPSKPSMVGPGKANELWSTVRVGTTLVTYLEEERLFWA